MSSYPWEKVFTALRFAVADQNTLQFRLATTWMAGIHLLEEKELPPEIWEQLQTVKSRLTTVRDAGSEGIFMASAKVLSDEEAGQRLREIVDIFSAICRAQWESPKEVG